MGLISAALGAAGGTLADQWLEFFYCESLPKDVLVKKGQHRVSKRSSNYKGNDNIISNGSGIAVADGQCMIIVEQGAIVELCAEPGEYTYDTSSEPSIFYGGLGQGIVNTFKTFAKRFAYGGDTGKDQRIYYFNTKEIMDNKFGTPNPVPFRVVDSRIGLDVDVSVRCSGTYSFVMTDPIMFYKNVAGNVADEYNFSEIEGQLKAEFVGALPEAFGRLSELEMRPNQIQTHTSDLENAINQALAQKWGDRGIRVKTISLNPITLPKEDEEMIKTAQRNAMYRDPTMGAAAMVGATQDSMKIAAGNQGGAMMGFMGMNMAQQAGGMNAQNLYAMGMQQQQMQQMQQQQQPQAQQAQPAAGAWTCPNCGKPASGKFCPECGTPKPVQSEGWTCSCGTVNKGKFCSNCGNPKPAGTPKYKCDKCGWEPDDPANPPKFCPECGDPFDDNDLVK
ncbi:MAG: SPFH domain-containing protein [Eubacterium sp.]|nr:SPFH domain-containing protein [Eubacterium sp.]